MTSRVDQIKNFALLVLRSAHGDANAAEKLLLHHSRTIERAADLERRVAELEAERTKLNRDLADALEPRTDPVRERVARTFAVLGAELGRVVTQGYPKPGLGEVARVQVMAEDTTRPSAYVILYADGRAEVRDHQGTAPEQLASKLRACGWTVDHPPVPVASSTPEPEADAARRGADAGKHPCVEETTAALHQNLGCTVVPVVTRAVYECARLRLTRASAPVAVCVLYASGKAVVQGCNPASATYMDAAAVLRTCGWQVKGLA